MSFFFVPPPVVGPIPFDSTFSEFSIRRVGDVDPPTLSRLEDGLRRRNFSLARADMGDTVRIVVTSRICHALVAEVEAMKLSRGGPVLVVSFQSRHGPVDPWRVLDAGADDLLLWDEEGDTIGAIAARLRRWRETQLAIESLRGQGVVVGVSRVWREALARLVEAAKFGVAPVLIVGETGTGKELLARCVHALDPRPEKGELVLVDGATLNPELSGSELFGHEKGAFTGALTRRDGALARAHGGTIFLDEVGEIPPVLQGELLRAVQDGLYKPVGGDRWMESSFRLVCATNRDLAEEVERGGFRRDLFFRIAGSICQVPALRERREDIPSLVDHFLGDRRPGPPPRLDPAVADFLVQRGYPGNVRELKQVVDRLLSRYPGEGPLTAASIPETERKGMGPRLAARKEEAFGAAVRLALSQGCGLEAIRRTVTQEVYSIVLAEEGGDTGRAAARLKVSKRAVQMFVKDHPPRSREPSRRPTAAQRGQDG